MSDWFYTGTVMVIARMVTHFCTDLYRESLFALVKVVESYMGVPDPVPTETDSVVSRRVSTPAIIGVISVFRESLILCVVASKPLILFCVCTTVKSIDCSVPFSTRMIVA